MKTSKFLIYLSSSLILNTIAHYTLKSNESNETISNNYYNFNSHLKLVLEGVPNNVTIAKDSYIFPYKISDKNAQVRKKFRLSTGKRLLAGTSILKYYYDEILRANGLEDIFPLVEKEVFGVFTKCIKSETGVDLTVISSKEYKSHPYDPMKRSGIYVTSYDFDALDDAYYIGKDKEDYNSENEFEQGKGWHHISEISPFSYHEIRAMKFLQSVAVLDSNEIFLGKFQVKVFIKYRSASILEIDIDGFEWSANKVSVNAHNVFKRCKFVSMKSLSGSRQGFHHQIWV